MSQDKMQRIKSTYIQEVEEAGDSIEERGAAPIIERVKPITTVSKHNNSFTFRAKYSFGKYYVKKAC
jgi:hypothetical protein